MHGIIFLIVGLVLSSRSTEGKSTARSHAEVEMTAGDKERCQDQGLDQHIEIMDLINSNQLRLAAEKAKAWFQKELLQRPDLCPSFRFYALSLYSVIQEFNNNFQKDGMHMLTPNDTDFNSDFNFLEKIREDESALACEHASATNALAIISIMASKPEKLVKEILQDLVSMDVLSHIEDNAKGIQLSMYNSDDSDSYYITTNQVNFIYLHKLAATTLFERMRSFPQNLEIGIESYYVLTQFTANIQKLVPTEPDFLFLTYTLHDDNGPACERAHAGNALALLYKHYPQHADAEVLERILNLSIADKEKDMKVIRANGTQRHEEVFEMERDTFFDLLHYHTPTFLNQRQHFQKKIISLKGSNQLREAADTAKLWFEMERSSPHDQVPELGPSYHLLALGLFTSILRQYKHTSGSDLACLHHLYTDKSALASERAHAGNAIVALCLQISNHESQRVSAKKLRNVYMNVCTTILDLTIADEEKEINLVGCDNPYEFDCKASFMSNFTNNDIFEVEMELARHMIEDLTKMEKDKINPVDPALRYFTLILLCFLIGLAHGLALYINRASVSRWLKKASRRYFLTPFKKLRDQWATKAAAKEAATRKAARLEAEQEALRAASAEEELQRKKKEKLIADLKAAKEKAAREKEKAQKERQQQERRQAEERKSSGSTRRDAATPPQQVSPQPQERKVKGGQSDMTKISIADHALASNLDDQAMIFGLIEEPVKIMDDEPLQHPIKRPLISLCRPQPPSLCRSLYRSHHLLQLMQLEFSMPLPSSLSFRWTRP